MSLRAAYNTLGTNHSYLFMSVAIYYGHIFWNGKFVRFFCHELENMLESNCITCYQTDPLSGT